MADKKGLQYKLLLFISTAYLAVDINIQGFLALLTGLFFSIITGATLLPFLGEKFGWRNAVGFSALTAVLVGIFIFMFFKEKSENKGEKYAAEQRNDLSFKKSIVKLFQNKDLLIVCLFGLILGFNSGAIPAHYTLYLTQDMPLSRTAAGFAFGLLQIGGILGRPLWGFLNDRFLKGSRSKGLVIVGLFLTLILLYYFKIMSAVKLPLFVIYLSSLVLGTVTLGWMGLYFTEFSRESLAYVNGRG